MRRQVSRRAEMRTHHRRKAAAPAKLPREEAPLLVGAIAFLGTPGDVGVLRAERFVDTVRGADIVRRTAEQPGVQSAQDGQDRLPLQVGAGHLFKIAQQSGNAVQRLGSHAEFSALRQAYLRQRRGIFLCKHHPVFQPDIPVEVLLQYLPAVVEQHHAVTADRAAQQVV